MKLASLLAGLALTTFATGAVADALPDMAGKEITIVTENAYPPLQFLDKDGNSVSQAIDDRAIGMPLDKVLEVPEKILSAAGPHKVDIIRAACRRGLIDTLITDDVTAELLLAETP